MTVEIEDEAAPILKRVILIQKPGVYPNITSRQYFAEPCPEPALTSSGIKALMGRTAAEFAYEHPAITPDSPEAASTAAKRFGDVAHQLSLGKGRGYAVGDFKTWASKDAKTFKAEAEANGLTPVKAHEFAKAQACADVMLAKIADTLGVIGGVDQDWDTEVVIAWQEETRAGPVWCRAMLDVWCPTLGVIADPKFTDRMADGVWENYATNMGYDLQAAWYMRGISKLFPDLAGRVRFVNLLCSPKPPHISRTREADEATRYSCELMIESALERFGACLYADKWPAYPDMIEPWTAKPWTMAQRAAAAEMEDA